MSYIAYCCIYDFLFNKFYNQSNGYLTTQKQRSRSIDVWEQENKFIILNLGILDNICIVNDSDWFILHDCVSQLDSMASS
jgi:hypothetical protein